MKAKHHALLYTFLGIALILSVVWGAVSTASADRLHTLAQQGYEQRILETQERLQAIQIKLDKAMVASDAGKSAELLFDVSHQADGVVMALSSLPLSHAALSDTMKFCNQLSEWAFTQGAALADGKGIASERIEEMSSVQSDCALLLGQIATASAEMAASGVTLALSGDVYYDQAQSEQRPLEQVADPERGMNYPSMIYDGAFSDARHYGEPKALANRLITAQEALDIAREYIGSARVASIARSSDTEGALASYGAVATLTDGETLSIEVTKQGGQVLWMMPEHASFEQRLTLTECENAALAFFDERGYGTMEANHYQLYNGLAVINFVPTQQGVLLYPDLVKAQVRMDTGEVVGVEANNYLMNHVSRSSLTAKLTKDEARARVSERLTTSQGRLCLIPHLGGERLCYEFPGEYADSRFLVYIDANTGEEVEILKLIQTENAMLSA